MNIPTEHFKKAMSILGMSIGTKANLPPATKLIELSTKDGNLYGYTYNQVCFVKYRICSADEDIDVTVDYNTLCSLVKGVDGDTIKITSTDKTIVFKTDKFTTKLPCYSSQNNERLIKYPVEDMDEVNHFDADLKDYLIITKYINQKIGVLCYKGVYFGNTIMVSDINNVAIIRDHLFPKDVLLNAESVNLLNTIKEFDYSIVDGGKYPKIVIKTDRINATIITMPKDEFQYADYMELYDMPIDNNIEVDRKDLVDAISTANKLKITKVELLFSDKGIFIRNNNIDFLYQVTSTSCTACSYNVSLEFLSKWLIGDRITIFYGNEDFIKIVSGIKELCLGI